MFKNIRRMASGRGTVAFQDWPSTSEFLVTEYVFAIDKFTVIERFPYKGPEDKLACVAMVRGFVDTYAEAN